MDVARLIAAGFLLIGFTMPSAHAVEQIIGLDNLEFGLWTPAQGNVSASDDFCVAAQRANSRRPGPYAVRVTPLASTVFELRGIVDPAAVIPLALTFQDLTDGVTSPLVPATFSPREQAGVLPCSGVNNARLIATALASGIVAAPPGEYQGQFQFTGQSIPPKTQISRNFQVRLRVAEMIRISGLDSIDLGAFDGVNSRQGEDDFCVYSNGMTGRYTVTGYGQGGGGAFQVASGAGTLPVQVEYDDGTGLAPMTPGAPAQKQNADRVSIDCIGGSNAQIRTTVEAADLRNAPAGTYAGEITLIVAPI
jgi:hypothetical protein